MGAGRKPNGQGSVGRLHDGAESVTRPQVEAARIGGRTPRWLPSDLPLAGSRASDFQPDDQGRPRAALMLLRDNRVRREAGAHDWNASGLDDVVEKGPWKAVNESHFAPIL